MHSLLLDFTVQFDNQFCIILCTVQPLHDGHLGDRRKWPQVVVLGGRGVIHV